MVFGITAAFVLMDIITGVIKAFKEKNYNSTVMREGLFHKAGSILVIVLGEMVDYAQTLMDLGFSVEISVGLCVYIIIMEIGSIIENVHVINPDLLPSELTKYFGKIAVKEGEEDGNSNE